MHAYMHIRIRHCLSFLPLPVLSCSASYIENIVVCFIDVYEAHFTGSVYARTGKLFVVILYLDIIEKGLISHIDLAHRIQTRYPCVVFMPFLGSKGMVWKKNPLFLKSSFLH